MLTPSASLMKENLLSPAWPPAITLTYSTWRSFMTNIFYLSRLQTLQILPPFPSAEPSKGEDWLNMERLSLGTASTAQQQTSPWLQLEQSRGKELQAHLDSSSLKENPEMKNNWWDLPVYVPIHVSCIRETRTVMFFPKGIKLQASFILKTRMKSNSVKKINLGSSNWACGHGNCQQVRRRGFAQGLYSPVEGSGERSHGISEHWVCYRLQGQRRNAALLPRRQLPHPRELEEGSWFCTGDSRLKNKLVRCGRGERKRGVKQLVSIWRQHVWNTRERGRVDLVDREKQQAEIKEKNAGCLLLAKLAWVCNNPPKKTTLLKATQIWRGRELPPKTRFGTGGILQRTAKPYPKLHVIYIHLKSPENPPACLWEN